MAVCASGWLASHMAAPRKDINTNVGSSEPKIFGAIWRQG